MKQQLGDTMIGTNPLPLHIQDKLVELVGLIDAQYETRNGSTSLYWLLSYHIASELVSGKA